MTEKNKQKKKTSETEACQEMGLDSHQHTHTHRQSLHTEIINLKDKLCENLYLICKVQWLHQDDSSLGNVN